MEELLMPIWSRSANTYCKVNTVTMNNRSLTTNVPPKQATIIGSHEPLGVPSMDVKGNAVGKKFPNAQKPSVGIGVPSMNFDNHPLAQKAKTKSSDMLGLPEMTFPDNPLKKLKK